MPYQLLFVCLGNICRSPSAENIMNHLIKREGMEHKIKCDSAGTASYHIGNPPDRRMNAAANKRGMTLLGSARQFAKSDFEEFDLILVMDRDNYADVCALDRAGKFSAKVRLMCDFCTQHTLREVPDPYYGGEAGFDQVIDLLMDACGGLLAHVKQELGVSGKS